LRRVHLLSVRSETLEGGVVVRGGANFRAGSAYWPEVATGGWQPVDETGYADLSNRKRTVGKSGLSKNGHYSE